MTLAVAIPCALAAAIAYGASTAVEHSAAHTVDEPDRGLLRLLRDPRWLIGMLGDTVGLVLQVIALATGPVSLVQPILILAASSPADPAAARPARSLAGRGLDRVDRADAHRRRALQRPTPEEDAMTITPVELHHIRLKRGLLGYRRKPVDELILEIADSFEEVWRQRADYADRIEQLEGELSRHRDLESLLRTTLVSAEKSLTS